jgi:multiple sugar transport system substrate-binding protein
VVLIHFLVSHIVSQRCIAAIPVAEEVTGKSNKGREIVIRNIVRAALLGTALLGALGTSSYAQETVVWWDFLTGGDGARMKKLIEDFNAENAGKIKIEATTLEWGTPFYTKVQTSTAVGEGPDVMTYHTSRLPLAVSQGTVKEITAEDWAAMGLSQDSFAPATWDAVQVDGKQYAVPFDTHPIVLYYNKDKLEQAGLLGPDGLPANLDGIENFSAALKKVQEAGTEYGLATLTANGDFAFRTFYSYLCQQDGTLGSEGDWLPGDNLQKMVNSVKVVADWVTNGYAPAQTDYSSMVALFTTGRAAFMINGVWEVPTMNDLKSQDKLFNWGAIELPVMFDHACTYSDSHSFAIPNNAGKEVSPEKHAAVLATIKWMEEHSLFWATAGHIPANKAVTESAEYKAMEPQATYAKLTENAVFDAKSRFAGVASPLFDAAGNSLTPAINGEVDVEAAVTEFRDTLNELQ